MLSFLLWNEHLFTSTCTEAVGPNFIVMKWNGRNKQTNKAIRAGYSLSKDQKVKLLQDYTTFAADNRKQIPHRNKRKCERGFSPAIFLAFCLYNICKELFSHRTIFKCATSPTCNLKLMSDHFRPRFMQFPLTKHKSERWLWPLKWII